MKAVQSTKVGPVIHFVNEIINVFGVPRRIISDRGSCYTSKRFMNFCLELSVKLVHNATATPRANGQVERYNRTILSLLSASSSDEEKWDNCVRKVQWGLNSTSNSTTGESPHKLMFGYQLRSAPDAFIETAVSKMESERSNITQIREQASARILREQEKQKQKYDKKRTKTLTYELGQSVLVRKTTSVNDGKSRKLLPKYGGPYVVTKILGNDRYLVEDLLGAQRTQKPYKGVCAVDRMKPFVTQVSSDESSCEAEEDRQKNDNDPLRVDRN